MLRLSAKQKVDIQTIVENGASVAPPPQLQINISLFCSHIPLIDQTVKNPPAMQETWVQSLGQEDPLEKGMATHSSILAWRIPRTEEAGGLQSMGSQRIRRERLTLSLWL